MKKAKKKTEIPKICLVKMENGKMILQLLGKVKIG